MCGIAGLIRRDDLSCEDLQAVVRMTDAQSHRGPDGVDHYSDSHVALGHRRLAIIDVSTAGAQPMPNEDRSVWVTYNGEIYNHVELRGELLALGHRFRSATDSEVLVHGYEQWGVAGLLERLRGMFAFGLYDVHQGLLLARDRIGIKPLYYHLNEQKGELYFASEVKALLRSGRVPEERDRDAIAGFLLGGSVPAPRTIVKAVQCLLPGHYLRWRDGRTSIAKYWDLRPLCESLSTERRTAVKDADRRAATAAIRDLLTDSVARHLVSDVPLGVFLSGGVDSGAIVALASRASGRGPLTTLTVTFDDETLNEASAARAAARRFGTDHREVHVTAADFARELPNIFAAMDQPTNDGVNTYFVSKAARDAGLTVVLSGLGGDEVFWGYDHHARLQGRLTRLVCGSSAVRKLAARAGAAWGAARGKDNWMRMEFLDRGGSDRELYLLLRGFFPPPHVQRLLELTDSEMSDAVDNYFAGIGSGAIADASTAGFNVLEFKRYLHDQLLRDTDVFSMAHSVEVRVPLLDHTLVEGAAAAGAELKTRNGTNKPLLVAAVGDSMLHGVARSTKQGFSFPMNEWLKAPDSDLEDLAASNGDLHTPTVRTLWSEFRGGRLHWSRAWALTVMGAAYRDERPRPRASHVRRLAMSSPFHATVHQNRPAASVTAR
jgi:asparagine synthase (glutamine-hydrolysing)